ncbi:MAG: beta galactosidase jelly roll domain-containing protein [Bacteroidales bacterium]|nr:beta galactosidase jelly roll domain-containing protein [Bacteroidales bacterium]
MILRATHIGKRAVAVLALICLMYQTGKCNGYNENLTLLMSLRGNWSFSIGINDEWISPKYNDSDWETIRVPGSWEDQGFNGYNGYAFYRRKITIPASYKGRMLYLKMGYIDDVDAVYLNGHKIGSTGSFPPNYLTAYNANRTYYIPDEYINFDGLNLITVKVYDSQQAGGIVSGDVGLYGGKASVNLEVNLQSQWKFKTGDDLARKAVDYNDSQWDNLFVPAKWEDQGYRDYDGYAWYRKTFVYQGNATDKTMVILLGKIDDIDQVYINGTFVGETGTFPSKWGQRVNSDQHYNAFRGYYFPASLLKKGQNTIAVRVLDTGGEGGIYEGPVGILTQTQYIEYWRKIKRSGN